MTILQFAGEYSLTLMTMSGSLRGVSVGAAGIVLVVLAVASIPLLNWFIHKEVTKVWVTVADPGFHVEGGGGAEPLGGDRPLMWVLFGENMQKRKNWILLGGCTLAVPPGSTNGLDVQYFCICDS